MSSFPCQLCDSVLYTLLWIQCLPRKNSILCWTLKLCSCFLTWFFLNHWPAESICGSSPPIWNCVMLNIGMISCEVQSSLITCLVNNGLANYFQNLCKSGVLFLGLNLDTIVFRYCILGSLNELNYMIVFTNAVKKMLSFSRKWGSTICFIDQCNHVVEFN